MVVRIIILVLFFNHSAIAQNNVGIGTATPVPSAALDLTSANSTLKLSVINTTYFNYGHQRLNSGSSLFTLERYED